MKVLRNRKIAVRMGAYGGLLLVLSGGTQGTALVERAYATVSALAPELAAALLSVFFMAAALASFGGITVIVGALVLERGYRIPAKVAYLLGSGAGLIGFIVQLVALSSSGNNPLVWVLGLGVTLQGLGSLFALVAQATA